MIWYVPLESLDKRYTSMQDIVTRKAFKKLGKKFKVIEGEVLSNELKSSQFLNPQSTMFYKFSQLMKITKLFNEGKIKNGDFFYFSDLWFPGIESLKYISTFMGVKIKIYGILHAGSFTPTDTVNSIQGAKQFEECILQIADGIFLGSEQTKQDLIKEFRLDYKILSKLYVTGLAYDSHKVEKYRTKQKKRIVLFPHRLHCEKQRDLFEYLKNHIDAEFIVTHEMNLSKKEYYKLLAKSSVVFSASLQENFGYSCLEACSLGTTPVMPINNTCYKYMYPKELLYNTFEESIKLVKKYLNNPVDLKHLARKYDNSVINQVRLMK